jgi:tetraacyldisaccharide 4'-kinase
LGRAHVVVLSRVREGDAATGAIHDVKSAGYSGPIVRAGHRTTGFYDAAGAACAAPARALAFCGIGDPGLFRGDLAAAGVEATGFHTFRDHHPYTVTSWHALTAEARAMGTPLVTTDKDYSRLAAAVGAALSTAPLFVLRIETVVWDEAPLIHAVREAVKAGRRGAPR